MHDDRVVVEGRIARLLSDRLVPLLHTQRVDLSVEAWDVPGEPVPYAEAVAAGYRPFAVGESWGRPWGTTWLRCTVDVPAHLVGGLEAVIDLGFQPDSAGFQCEGLVWLDGRPLQGVHPRRTAVPLPEVGAGPLTFYVEAAANPSFPQFRPSAMGRLSTAGDAPLYRLRHAFVARRDDVAFALALDVETLLGVMRALPLDEPRRRRLLGDLQACAGNVEAGELAAARSVLRPALAQRAAPSAHRVIAVGHAHIDSAWLWPIRESVRKCARTFASATRLMAEYPDYHFVCSQAAQYEWMEQQYPDLFERIVAAAAAGQWHPVGAMWVEPDMNLPSGESLVRQLVHGQRYFERHFGTRCKEVWIPDVFGYPASLPQLFVQAGCPRFVTQKLSWNKQNTFPHSTFWWRGLDGSQVLAHFPPVDTYNANVTGEELRYAQGNFKDGRWSDWSLMPFGYGNGGGGPTREMMERARRLADLDGAPRVTVGTPSEFFEQVEAEVADGAPIATWTGELYFETHRGTLTGQLRTKLGNRRCERLLREAELWWATLGETPPEIDRLWRDVLLQQFHDILPGSSIGWVADDAEAEHARIASRLEELVGEALTRLAVNDSTMVANAASHARREVVDVDGLPRMVAAPGLGVAVASDAGIDDRVVTTEHSMANAQLAVRWDLDGTITSIIDTRAGRELLPVGRGITVELAPDHPVEYDAWDLEAWAHGNAVPIGGAGAVRFVEQHPSRSRVEVRRAFGASTITLSYTLRAGSARLDIGVDVDWCEEERILSLMVPLDVYASEAACDIQFGNVKRPTHASSPWDNAKFEVCAHRFVDVSEPRFGVAVLNDGRYGHSLFGGGVRVSLARATKYPDPQADRGRHSVTIAVLPHGAGLAEVLAEAEALNIPLRVVAGGARSTMPSPLVAIDHPTVQVSAVKLADDGSGDVIARLYEAAGDRAAVTVSTPWPIGAADRCNLLEEPSGSFEVSDGIVAFTMRPFEVVTLRLRPR